MAEEQERRRPSWGPFAAAAGVAVVVLVAAVGWSIFAGGPSDAEQSAIEACEAEYLPTGGPAIVGGEVFEPHEFADYYAVAETHGEVPTPLDEVTQEQRDAWADAGDQYEETGDGAVVVVWRLEDDAYLQCVVPVSGDSAVGDQAVVTELAIASEDE